MEETADPFQVLQQGVDALKFAFERAAPRWQEIYDQLRAIWQRLAQAIVRIWKPIKRHLLYVRSHGTQQQRRVAWKLLHPPKRRKVKTRVSHG